MLKKFLQNNIVLPCSCERPDLINKDHQHIITGDLWIIKNIKLKKLFTKDTKFRENNKISWVIMC